ncbi:hypothetical protein Syun_017641 [Stephania yunnanensis]|uniref:Saccharopine dehydrogenase NADP binding domain-containing protein n=1 Tax=Stephania yunnanensis TaxID=152371 RepID=A0AAP0P3J9_9MAGN
MAGASSWVQMNQSVVLACAKESDRNPKIRKKSSSSSRVLILGGTGRVGGSTALALSNLSPDLRILVGGRNRTKVTPTKGEGKNPSNHAASGLKVNCKFYGDPKSRVRALINVAQDGDGVYSGRDVAKEALMAPFKARKGLAFGEEQIVPCSTIDFERRSITTI